MKQFDSELLLAMAIRILKYSFSNILIICLLVFNFLFPLSLFADINIKRKIIEDCNEAKEEINRLQLDEQIKIIENLKLILEMRINHFGVIGTDLPGAPGSISGPIAPFEEIKGEDLWRALQHDRDIEAKLCALEILLSLSPHSIDTLPQMIRLTQEHTLPYKVLSLLYQTIQAVTLDAVNSDDFIISNDLVSQLVGMLDSQTKFYVQNALIEMGEKSLEIIYYEIKKPDLRRRELLFDTLLRIDSTGSFAGPAALKLLESADDDLRQRMLILLEVYEDFYAFSLPTIIELLDDISVDIQKSALHSLSVIFSRLALSPRIALKDESLDLLFKKLIVGSPYERRLIAPGLHRLLDLSGKYQKLIQHAFETADTDLHINLLEIIKGKKLQGALRKIVFQMLKNDSKLARLKAAQVITQADAHNSETLRSLIDLYLDYDITVRLEAEREILTLGKKITNEALLAFRKNSGKMKAHLLELLLKLKAKSREVNSFLASYLKDAECDDSAKFSILQPTLPNETRTSVFSKLTACLINIDTDYEHINRAIAALYPFSDEEKNQYISVLLSDSINEKSLVSSLEHLPRYNLTQDVVAEVVIKLLFSKNKSIQYRVLTFVNLYKGQLPIKEQLVKVKDKYSDDDLLLNETILALSKFQDPNMNISDFYFRQIEKSKYKWAEKYLPRLETSIAMQTIEKSFKDLPHTKKHLACSLAGEIGYAAVAVLPLIKPLLDSADPKIAYAAALALVKIDPSDPLAIDSFRAILSRDISENLYNETFNSTIQPFFAQLKASSVSRAEMRIIERLSKRIKAN